MMEKSLNGSRGGGTAAGGNGAMMSAGGGYVGNFSGDVNAMLQGFMKLQMEQLKVEKAKTELKQAKLTAAADLDDDEMMKSRRRSENDDEDDNKEKGRLWKQQPLALAKSLSSTLKKGSVGKATTQSGPFDLIFSASRAMPISSSPLSRSKWYAKANKGHPDSKEEPLSAAATFSLLTRLLLSTMEDEEDKKVSPDKTRATNGLWQTQLPTAASSSLSRRRRGTWYRPQGGSSPGNRRRRRQTTGGSSQTQPAFKGDGGGGSPPSADFWQSLGSQVEWYKKGQQSQASSSSSQPSQQISPQKTTTAAASNNQRRKRRGSVELSNIPYYTLLQPKDFFINGALVQPKKKPEEQEQGASSSAAVNMQSGSSDDNIPSLSFSLNPPLTSKKPPSQEVLTTEKDSAGMKKNPSPRVMMMMVMPSTRVVEEQSPLLRLTRPQMKSPSSDPPYSSQNSISIEPQTGGSGGFFSEDEGKASSYANANAAVVIDNDFPPPLTLLRGPVWVSQPRGRLTLQRRQWPPLPRKRNALKEIISIDPRRGILPENNGKTVVRRKKRSLQDNKNDPQTRRVKVDFSQSGTGSGNDDSLRPVAEKISAGGGRSPGRHEGAGLNVKVRSSKKQPRKTINFFFTW